MFDVGFQELTLIGVIALIVVGPERLPKMARTLGLWMGKIRYYVRQVKDDIDREVRAQELKEMLDKPAREFGDLGKVAEEAKGALDQAKGALGEAKSAFEDAPAGVSTPNEPAAGSIFPTELPDTDAGPARSGPPAADPPETAATETEARETEARETEARETEATEAAPVEAGRPETGEAKPGEGEAPAAATDAGEDDERASERI